MATASDINKLSDDTHGQQDGKEETFTYDDETAWKDFEIDLRWNADYDSVSVLSNKIGDPCTFQYALSYDKKQIEDTLKKADLKISCVVPDKAGFEIDALGKNCASVHDAWADLHDLFTGYFRRYKNIALPVNREKSQRIIEAYGAESNEHLFQNVALYIDKDTKVMRMVGYESDVDKVLKELKIEMNEAVFEIDIDTWERLLPDRLIQEEAYVHITETGNKFRVSGDATEVDKVKQVLRRIEDNSSLLDTIFDKIEHIKLLIQDRKTNDSVFAYFKTRLREAKLDVFFEMFEEAGGKAVVRLHAKTRVAAKAAHDVIKKSIVEFSLDQNEVVCIKEELDDWSRRKKLKSFKKRATLDIICTSDVAKLICEVDCNIDIPLPNMVCDYLTNYGNEIVEDLRTRFKLKVAQVCTMQQSVKISGCLGMVQEFRKHLSEMCKLCTLTIPMPVESLAEHGTQIKAIGHCHQCLTTAEKVYKYRSCIFTNCSIAAEWQLYDDAGNSSKVSVICGDINNIHIAVNVAKVQFVKKTFQSLQDIPMKQHEYQHEWFDVYGKTRSPGKMVYWHDLHMLPTAMTKAEWLVEIVLKRTHSLSQYLGDVFREAVVRKCQHLVIPLELLRSISPSDIAGACIKVLADIQYPFQVIFQCHSKAKIGDVVRRVETLFKKEAKLCIRENIHPDLSPNTDLSPIVVTLENTFLASLQVDVIVNTVSKPLDLSLGYMSRSILKSAGDIIQQECKEEYPNGIQNGEIAVTSAGTLGHRHIFHCALPRFHKHTVAENVKSMVWKCLVEADRRQCTSIAFPAFGTGKLRYPPRETASAMLEAIDEYKKRVLNSCLQKIMISVPDILDVSKVFYNEYSRRCRRLRCTMGTGISDCCRLSKQFGSGIYTTSLHVIAEKDVDLLSSQFVIICLGHKESAAGRFVFLNDGNTSHDQCLVYFYDEMRVWLKEALKYLCSLNVSDVVIDTRGIEVDSQQFVLDIIQILQEFTKESDKNICAVYLQNIVALVKDKEMPSLTKHLCPSSGIKGFVSYMSTKPVWQSHTVSKIDVGFTILGKTDYDTSEVRRKLKTFLDFDSFLLVDQDGDTDVDEVVDVLGNDQFPGDTVLAKEENTNDLLLNESFDEMVTAELNPGLVKFLQKSALFKSWQDDVKDKFKVTLKYEGTAMVVSGSFEAILEFESFLEEHSVDNVDDESHLVIEVEHHSIVDLKPDIGNKETDEKSSDNSEEDIYYTCSEQNSEKKDSPEGWTNDSRTESEPDYFSGDLDKSMDAAHKEPNTCDGFYKPETDNNVTDTKYKHSPESLTHVSRIEIETDKSMDNDSKKFHKVLDGAKSMQSNLLDFVDIESVKPVSSFKLHGIEVCLLSGNLTTLWVDCIVNSANEHLSETFGISKALARAGGPVYNEAIKNAKGEYGPLTPGTCIDTVSGALPCHCVIHAVGPTPGWPAKSEQERLQVLQETVEMCLRMADGNRYASVAMPIIGCGAGGMSESHCAIQYYRALTAFSSSQTMNQYLKKVYLVEIEGPRIRNIAAELEHLMSHSADRLQRKETTKVKNSQQFDCKISNVNVLLLETEHLISVKADAILCIENFDSVGDGVVSNLLLRNGGQQYVENTSALKTKSYRDKLVKYQYQSDHYVHEVPLKSSKLEYQYVLHSTLRESSTDKKKPAVSTIVQDALLKAAVLKCQSVCIPIVGMTDKGSPVSNKPMWDEVMKGLCQYVADQRYSALKEIKIVCQTPNVFEYMKAELCKLQQFGMISNV